MKQKKQQARSKNKSESMGKKRTKKKQQQKKNVRLPQFISIIAAYEHFKSFEVAPGVRQNDRLDFTDMLEKFVTEGQ